MGFWYLGMGTATVTGALVAYGLLYYTADRFRSWQLMFLIFGLITIAVGIAVVLFLPDNPMSSHLTHEEKLVAIERLRENKTGIENKHFKMEQFLESWKDPQTYLIILIVLLMMVPNGAISSFSTILIKGFGYMTKQTKLLFILGSVIQTIFILAGTYFAGKYN